MKKDILKKYENSWVYISFNMRKKSEIFGRFGGGWNWQLGFQIGGSTIIINLLVASVRIWFKRFEE